ncbi:Putative major facilitator, sugar transporter, major facilitator superfamily [Septoria linicola]|uniref:Major facilitator, sugar transporter, major facilitator superfamily n=1 Tax=Septoria linicola TaxID=215465 RepID=A0A9Q9AD69_9PEZI|nr:putative major facilitator, sugar transporter, major facilitator superfamily [Septoria linicola]USW47389.1 Putative major facilitator, sugar transporter, major facilitator superfamily [Septoria linicola]
MSRTEQGVEMMTSEAHYMTRTSEVPERTFEVQGNVDYLAAVMVTPLNAWFRTSFELYSILLIACLNATASGFDSSIFSTINAMDQYKAFFHQKETGSSTGIIFAIYTLGSLSGAVFTGPVLDLLGRGVGIGAGAVIIMTGAIVTTAARSEAYLLVGRLILGLGIALGTSAAPTYAIELAPPQWRARVTGYYNSFFYSGSILATGVTYATAKISGSLSWRLPLTLQCIPPLFILAGSFCIPESPRWLCSHGRFEEATKILAKHHGAGNANHPLVQLELRELREFTANQKMRAWWDWRELVQTHSARWRLLMVTLMSYGSQLSGNSCLTYYLPTIIVSCAGALFGSATNDRFGRRTKLWIGSFALAGLFAAVTGISSQFASRQTAAEIGRDLSNAGVSMIFLFEFVYSFVYTPLTATYCAESLDNHTRATGMGIHVMMNNTANFYNTYVTAVALEAIAWKYYLVFVSLNVIYGFLWFFLGVETRRRTLEELQEVFEARWPPSASLTKYSIIRVPNGQSDRTATA